MEQILNKLSEIEITAQRIMEDAGRSKAALSAEMEQQCRNFDAELEQETNRKIQELKDNLEAQKDQELTSLRHRTEQQLEDLDSVFHYYQKLISLRKEKEIIVYGEFEPLYREDERIFAYTRKGDQEKLLTVCNFSDKNAEVEVPEEFKGAECLITNLGRKEFDGKIILNPYEAFVLYYKHQVTEK